MKGAKGLLISITGGRDLTLYEVDEAATRIREEVDQDANIIVGATFDESLEGIIRVSVVATGIDHSVELKAPRPVPHGGGTGFVFVAPEQRLPEVTQKLRADQQRLAERIERSTTTPRRPRCRRSARPRGDRERRQGRGRGSGAADDHGRRDDPADAAEAVAVPRTRRRAEGGLRAAGADRLHSAGGGAAGESRAADAANRRTAAAGPERAARQRGEAAPAEPRRSGAWACCSGWPRSASAAAGGGRAAPSPGTAGPAASAAANGPGSAAAGPADAAAACAASARAVPAVRAGVGICPAAGPTRGSTRSVGRLLCIIRPRRINSTSRPSCAGRPTRRCVSGVRPVPAGRREGTGRSTPAA